MAGRLERGGHVAALACIGVTAISSACEPAHSVAARRDSAGVAIVTSAEPAWDHSESWRLDSMPDLDIGDDTDPHSLFSSIASVLTLSRGRIVVADAEAGELRIFDSTGAWKQTLGRRGEGPGEFADIRLVAADQWDTLRVVDENLGRITIFHPDTGLVRTVLQPPGLPWAEAPIAWLDSGRWLYEGERGPSTPSPPGIWRDTSLVIITSAAMDAVIDTVGTFAGTERLILEADFQGRTLSMMAPLPFGLDGSIVSDGERIAVATGEEWRVDVLDQTGIEVMSIRRPVPRERAGAEAADSVIQRYLQVTGEQLRPVLEAGLRDYPARELRPAYGKAYFATDGKLWVTAYQYRSELPRAASIFDRDGVWQGDVTIPGNLVIHEIGADYVLGVFTDDLGAPRVRRYRMRRGN